MTQDETLKTRKRYDRFSRFYDILESFIEGKMFRRLRKETISDLKGNILEIGVGTGKNLQYYPKSVRLTAIDLSQGMLKKAKQKAGKLGSNIRLMQMDAENLRFKDKSFDYIVATFVLCSIPNPIKALKEMKRVTKKDGQMIFIDHVLSKNKLIASWQHIHNPITRRIFGFNVNRDTRSNIQKAGLKIIQDEKLALFDIFRRFHVKIP